MTATSDHTPVPDSQTTDYKFSPKQSLIGAQMLFVAFGALVLVREQRQRPHLWQHHGQE